MTKEEIDSFLKRLEYASETTCEAALVLREICNLLVDANVDEHCDVDSVSEEEYEKIQAAELVLWHVAVARSTRRKKYDV